MAKAVHPFSIGRIKMSAEMNRLITAINNKTITKDVDVITLGCNGDAEELRDILNELFQSIPPEVMKDAGFELWDDMDEWVMLSITSTRLLTEEERGAEIQKAKTAMEVFEEQKKGNALSQMFSLVKQYPEEAEKFLRRNG